MQMRSKIFEVWAHDRRSRSIYATGVHGLMQAHELAGFSGGAEAAQHDHTGRHAAGMDAAVEGGQGAVVVYGPTLMLHVLEMAGRENITVGFYGGSPQVLEALVSRMQARFPDLKIAYTYSPPYPTTYP